MGKLLLVAVPYASKRAGRKHVGCSRTPFSLAVTEPAATSHRMRGLGDIGGHVVTTIDVSAPR
jgi:hypothetical protein